MAARDQDSMAGAAIAVGTLGAAVLLVLPVLVGTLRLGYGFSNAELGYFSFAHLIGLALGAASGVQLFTRTGLRNVTRVGLIVTAAANGAASAVSGLGPLVAAAAIAGLGSGVAIASCFVVLSRSKNVDRNFGLYTLCQLVFGAAVLHALPSFLNTASARGVFVVLSGLFTLALLLTRYLPCSAGNPARNGGDSRSPAWIALAAILIYFIAQGAIWTYLELIGQRWALERQSVASAIALSTLVGLGGPFLAAVIGSRFGRAIPLLLGRCVSLTALYCMAVPFGAVQFTVAVCLFSLAWNFSAPFQLSAIATADTSGRTAGLAASATLGGLAVGPLVGALALDFASFDGPLWLSALLFILSYVALVPILRRAGCARASIEA